MSFTEYNVNKTKTAEQYWADDLIKLTVSQS